MKITPSNVSFGSKYQIKGEDIYLNKPGHLMALGFGIGASKNSTEMTQKVFGSGIVGAEDYIFDIKDKDDKGFEHMFTEAGIRFNKIG